MHITADWFLTPTGCRAYADWVYERRGRYVRLDISEQRTRQVLLRLANAHERRGA